MDIPERKHHDLAGAAETARDKVKMMKPSPATAVALHLLERIIKNSTAVTELTKKQGEEMASPDQPETGKESSQQGHRTLDYLKNMGADLDLDDGD